MSDNGEAIVHDQRGEAIGRLKATLKQYVRDNRALQAQVEAANQERDAANTRAVQAQKDFDASPLKGKVDELSRKLKEQGHRKVFDRLALKRGADEDALDILWEKSGYKVEGDVPDEAAVGELLDGLKGKPGISRLFGPVEPAAGRGQGGRDEAGSNKYRVTSAQMRDPDFSFNNQAAIVQAQQEGRLEIVD